MAIRTRHTLRLLIPALLLTACATRGPVPTGPPDSSAGSTPTITTPPAAATSPSQPGAASPTPPPTISCGSGTHLRAGECLANPSTATA
jgi:hypothetical protein